MTGGGGEGEDGSPEDRTDHYSCFLLFPESSDAQGGWGSLAAVSSPLAMMDFSCVCLHCKVQKVNGSVSKAVTCFDLFCFVCEREDGDEFRVPH